ncbi:MAG: hypothetical protein AB4041_12360 [Microcystaceae cyanobacterium]
MYDLSFPQLICPFAIWLILVCFFTSVCFATREGVTKLNKLHQIPCSRCSFSTGDYRLKCTVCPCQAFSEEAIHCLEFEKRQPTQWTIQIKVFSLTIIRLYRKTYSRIVKQLRLTTQSFLMLVRL